MVADATRLRSQLCAMERAEATTRILCWRSGPRPDYDWRPAPRPYCIISDRREYSGGAPMRTHRNPPLPFHADPSRPGWCRICGQPINERGGWRMSFRRPQSTRLTWHPVCTTTYFLWAQTSNYAAMVAFRQGGLCALTGEPIGPPAKEYVTNIEVDHVVPLFRVARDHADLPWCEMIRFWGLSNLQALSRAGHLQKCAEEARERSRNRTQMVAQEVLL